MSTKDGLIEIALGAKTGQIVAGSTVGTGLGTWLDLIPSEIGKLATLVGIVLSLVLIRSHLQRIKLDAQTAKVALKKSLLEIEIMEAKEEERQRDVERRKAEGKPTRRQADLQ